MKLKEILAEVEKEQEETFGSLTDMPQVPIWVMLQLEQPREDTDCFILLSSRILLHSKVSTWN